MSGVDERQAFAKLEALKDIRSKTISLEKTRVSLLVDVGQMEDEERCLVSFFYIFWVVPLILAPYTPLQTQISQKSDFHVYINTDRLCIPLIILYFFNLICLFLV